MAELHTEHLPASTPCCGKVLDAMSGFDVPAAGAPSVCVYCGAYLALNHDGSVRRVSTLEFYEYPLPMQRLLARLREIITTGRPG